jgi:hypothetical protein
VADTKRQEWTIDSMRSAVQAVKHKENGFPVGSTYVSIALDKQSNLNCDTKMFSLYKDIT